MGGCGVGVGGAHCSDFTFSVTVIYTCIHRTETYYTDRILTVTTTVNLTALSVPRLDSGGGGSGGGNWTTLQSVSIRTFAACWSVCFLTRNI